MAILSASHTHTWFNEPIAFKANNATYYSIFTEAGQVAVAKHDHSKQIIQVGSPRSIPITSNDHNNPAVLVLNNGKVLLAYSQHPGPCWAAISNNTYDVMNGWAETQLYDGSTYLNSYAHLCQTTDNANTIWWFFRDGLAGARPISFRINQVGGVGSGWTDNASTVKLINNGTQRPYFRINQSGLRIDICYTDGQPNEVATNSLYHVYLLLNISGSQFSAYKSDNTLIDTWPITGGTGLVNNSLLPFNVISGTKIYDGSSNNCWVWDVRRVGNNLSCVYPTFYANSSGHKYRLATLSGTTWYNEDICWAGDSSSPTTTGRMPQWIYPDASNSESQYSPGICLDPNTPGRVYLGKKYGNNDVRIEQWDRSGSVWGKTSDLTGSVGNGAVNARPFYVENSNPTNVYWFSCETYTTYLSFVGNNPGTLIPITTAKNKKETNPVWTPAYAPQGIKAFYLMNEGVGTSIADIAGGFSGIITGGNLFWNTDEYGPNLSGFSSSIYISIDSLAANNTFGDQTYPKWFSAYYKSNTSAVGQYLLGFGSGVNNPLIGLHVNNTVDGQAGGIFRDNTGTQQNIYNGTIPRDTGYHTLTMIIESPSSVRYYYDGVHKQQTTVNVSSITLDRGTIGALRRTSLSNPAVGCTISVIQVGTGSIPNPIHLHADMFNGQFLGSWNPDAQGVPTYIRNLFNGNNTVFFISDSYRL